MDWNEIEVVIKDYQSLYVKSKNDMTVVLRLVRMIKRLSDSERNDIIRFLVSEIAHNGHNLCDFSVVVLGEMHDAQTGPLLEQVFRSESENKSSRWRNELLIVMLKCGYRSDVYRDYLAANAKQEDIYQCLIRYTCLYPEDGLDRLADYLIDILHVRWYLPSEDKCSFVGFIPALTILIETDVQLIPRLISLVNVRDSSSAKHLQTLLLHCFDNYPLRYPKEILEQCKHLLQNGENL